MSDTTLSFPDELTPATMAEYEATMTMEASQCGLSVHDVELLSTLRAIEVGHPFLLHDQWVVATGQLVDGRIPAMSVDRTGGRVEIRKWRLTVSFIQAMLYEDGITFPGLPKSRSSSMPTLMPA